MHLLQDDYDRAIYFSGYFERSFLMVSDLKIVPDMFILHLCGSSKKSSLASVTGCQTSVAIFVKGNICYLFQSALTGMRPLRM